MKLLLEGHSYRYAVEQVLLQTLDGEKPLFTDEVPAPGEDYAVISLAQDGESATATARVAYDGKIFRGNARNAAVPTEDVARDRELQRIIKLAFFRAARQAASRELPWGATTGIRPSTIITKMLRSGADIHTAERKLIRGYYVTPARAGLARDCALTEMRVRETLGARDIALYIGIPFCPTRCAYCSFVSHSVEKSMKLIEPFLDTLKAEAAATAQVVRTHSLRVVSVYIGGGTPTTLSAQQLEELLSHIEETFDLSAVREYTVEAGRPDTITAEKLTVLREHGVSRVSVNPQTMSDEVLAAIGRLHSAEDTRRAYSLARSAGFDIINMDLIAGLPGDTVAGFRSSLCEVLSMEPQNITVHTLSLKRGTRVTLEETPVPSGDEVSQMLDFAHARLRSAGFYPYYLYRQKFTSGGFENTGWSRGSLPEGTYPKGGFNAESSQAFNQTGNDSLYNIIMMDELRSVLALGSGVTKLVVPEGHVPEGRIERIFNPKYPYEYIERGADIISGKSKISDFFERLFSNAV